MSILNIMNTDKTSEDYGKIQDRFIPEGNGPQPGPVVSNRNQTTQIEYTAHYPRPEDVYIAIATETQGPTTAVYPLPEGASQYDFWTAIQLILSPNEVRTDKLTTKANKYVVRIKGTINLTCVKTFPSSPPTSQSDPATQTPSTNYMIGLKAGFCDPVSPYGNVLFGSNTQNGYSVMANMTYLNPYSVEGPLSPNTQLIMINVDFTDEYYNPDLELIASKIPCVWIGGSQFNTKVFNGWLLNSQVDDFNNYTNYDFVGSVEISPSN